MATDDGTARDSTLTELVERLSHDARELVRAELALARAELVAAARRLGLAAALVAVGALCGLAALGALTATAIIALANVLPAWAAALIVAVALAALAGSMVVAGVVVGRRSMPPAPAETLESIKEDVSWLKTRARSGAT